MTHEHDPDRHGETISAYRQSCHLWRYSAHRRRELAWPAIFTLANQQKLLPILFETVRKMPVAEENAALFAVTKQQVIGQVLNQTVRSVVFADLYQKLRSAGLHPIVVKGQLCSRLYPQTDHRISADDDLLIPDGEFMACHE